MEVFVSILKAAASAAILEAARAAAKKLAK